MEQQEPALQTSAHEWQRRRAAAVRRCTAEIHRRVPHWIAIGARIWVDPHLTLARPERLRGEELVASACREIAARAQVVQRTLLTLLVSRDTLAWAEALADCERLAGELMRLARRDIDADLDRSMLFTAGIDAADFDAACAHALEEIRATLRWEGSVA